MSVKKLKNIGFEIYCFGISLLFYLFGIFPVNPKRIFVYGFASQGYGDHPKYIIRELLKLDGSYEIFWAAESKVRKPKNVTYVKPGSLKAFYAQATSAFWISTVRMPYFTRKRKNQRYIHTWHGAVALKRIEGECRDSMTDIAIKMSKHDSRMIDYYISPNRDKTELYKKHFWYAGGKILEIGSARNDIFFNRSEKFLNALRSRYRTEGKKVLLYAPTFRANRGMENYHLNITRILDALEKETHEEWVAYVRLHPTLADKSSQLFDYSDRIRNGSYIDDVQELLAVTDILITDYSSIIFDYINKEDGAAFIYAPDIEEYRKERNFHVDLYDTPFDICPDEDELITRMTKHDEQSYREKVRDFKKKYGYFDNGQASRKIAELIAGASK